MKKSVLCLAFLGLGCKSNPPADLKAEFEPIIKSFLVNKTSNKDLIIDSIKIYKVDTLTTKADSLRTYWAIDKSLDEIKDDLTAQTQAMREDIEQMKLTRGVSLTLFEHHSQNFKNDYKKSQELSNLHKAKMARWDNLHKLMLTNKLDSVTMTGYIVNFKVIAHDAANTEQNLDSLNLFFNKDKQITKRKV
jgi:hypothetical protein